MNNKFVCLYKNITCIISIFLVINMYSIVLASDEQLPRFDLPDTVLWLEIVINGKPSGHIIAVDYRNKHYWLTTEQLDQIGLSMLKPKDQQSLAIDQIAGVNVDYNAELQQLMIDLPTSWLPSQHITVNKTMYKQVEAKSSLGALMNYDIYATSPEQKNASDNVSLWTEQRVFDGFGVVSNTGIYRKSFAGEQSNNQSDRYVRYDTQWKYSNENSMVSYSFGDVITDSLPWSSSVRLGGFQIARNFATRPDLITYPLPQFMGNAAIPSTVDLYINNYKMDTQLLNPGPFTLETQPYINGAGNATVVTTDALGRQVSTTVPFYVASNLLGKGLTDYSFSSGILRRNYGLKSSDYSDAAMNGITRYGITDWLTVEGRAEGAQYLFSSGIGAGIRLSNLGVLNLSMSGSQANDKAWSKEKRNIQPYYNPITGMIDYNDIYTDNVPQKNKGTQAIAGYSYNNQVFSVNAQRIVRSEGYGDLSNYRSDYLLSRRQDQVTTSIGIGKLGAIGSGYFATRSARGDQTRIINLSWSAAVWRNVSLYASINKEIGGQGVSAQIMLSLPLDDWGTTSISSSRDNSNHWVTRTNWSRSAPTDGGIGWNLAFANGGRESDKYRQADITWRSDHFEAKGGMYGNKHDYTRWAEVTGAVVMMNGDIYTTNTINDAFALISTNSFEDVPVFYENQPIGKTNAKGYMLVPTVTSWYPTKLSIDSLNLPADVDIPSTTYELSVREKSGLLVDFKIKNIQSINLTLLDNNDKPLPKGSTVQTQDNKTSWVGWDGLVWLQDINTNNQLTVTRADTGKVCNVTLHVPKQKGIIYLGQQKCQ